MGGGQFDWPRGVVPGDRDGSAWSVEGVGARLGDMNKALPGGLEGRRELRMEGFGFLEGETDGRGDGGDGVLRVGQRGDKPGLKLGLRGRVGCSAGKGKECEDQPTDASRHCLSIPRLWEDARDALGYHGGWHL
jgi:hypothetical protein